MAAMQRDVDSRLLQSELINPALGAAYLSPSRCADCGWLGTGDYNNGSSLPEEVEYFGLLLRRRIPKFLRAGIRGRILAIAPPVLVAAARVRIIGTATQLGDDTKSIGIGPSAFSVWPSNRGHVVSRLEPNLLQSGRQLPLRVDCVGFMVDGSPEKRWRPSLPAMPGSPMPGSQLHQAGVYLEAVTVMRTGKQRAKRRESPESPLGIDPRDGPKHTMR